ncbi:MAG: hypothetical protein M1358_13835, partial [Chloroflexi bacterium]|nr:hypothetical protein [Chloroflexota bacterium]
ELLAAYMPQDYPEIECRIVLHSGGLIVEEVPVYMRERISGVSSIDGWRSIYYALKVTIAVLLAAVKHTPKVDMELIDAS